MQILWKNIDINYQCKKTYHRHSFRNKDFSCEICGKTFTSIINVERHIIAIHLGIKPLVWSFVEKQTDQL